MQMQDVRFIVVTLPIRDYIWRRCNLLQTLRKDVREGILYPGIEIQRNKLFWRQLRYESMSFGEVGTLDAKQLSNSTLKHTGTDRVVHELRHI